MFDRRVKNSFVEAVAAGNCAEVEAIVRAHPDVWNVPISGGTAMHLAASFGQIPMMEILLRFGLSTNVPKKDTLDTPLHRACSEGHVAAARWLIEHGADVNSGVQEDWSTPLISPVIKGHFDVVRLLVEHGADVNASYFAKSWGVRRNALDFALEHGHECIADYLREHGARPSNQV